MEPLGLLVGLMIGGSILGSIGRPRTPQMPQFDHRQIMDVIDKIAGVGVTHTKGADGRYTKSIEYLPRTKEEQERVDKIESLLNISMDNVLELYNKLPEQSENYMDFFKTLGFLDKERGIDIAKAIGLDVPSTGKFLEKIENFKQAQKVMLDDYWMKEENKLNEQLISNGHLDSSAANEMRAQIAQKRAISYADNNLKAEEYGSKFTQQDFMNQMTEYEAKKEGLDRDFDYKEKGRQGQEKLAQTEMDVKNSKVNAELQAETSKMNLLDAVKNKDYEKAAQSVAPMMSVEQHRQANIQHRNNMDRIMGNFQMRQQNPNLAQSLGQAMMGVGSMGMGYGFANGGFNNTTPANTSSYKGFDQKAWDKLKYGAY